MPRTPDHVSLCHILFGQVTCHYPVTADLSFHVECSVSLGRKTKKEKEESAEEKEIWICSRARQQHWWTAETKYNSSTAGIHSAAFLVQSAMWMKKCFHIRTEMLVYLKSVCVCVLP